MSAKWIIMLYMAADNGLANFAIESLKQLKDSTGDDVIVAAQLGIEGAAPPDSRRYWFDNKKPQPNSINDYRDKSWPNGNIDMSDPTILQAFVEDVYDKYGDKDGDASYCLICWGHGPEIRRTPQRALKNANRATGARTKRVYFTPLELKSALQSPQIKDKLKDKLKIIAMDACSMSTLEFAYELREFADFMVASQEEVPNESFPYGTLLNSFRPEKTDAQICRGIVTDYVDAYQDYICNNQTDMQPVRLSVLRLRGENGMARIAGPLQALAEAMVAPGKDASDNKSIEGAILKARQNSRGFVAGLYVDLYDFCNKLSKLSPTLKPKCDQVSAIIRDVAIPAETDGVSVPIVAYNKAAGGAAISDPCGGISIYFPFLDNDEHQKIEQHEFVVDDWKGVANPATDLGGKSIVALNTAARNLQYSIRWEIIKDVEAYYQAKNFDFEKDSHWHNFIVKRWSHILATRYPDTIDMRYSAQQCAANLA